MATDFAVSLRRYLTDHMAGLRGCSPNTITSYRDTFKLLICYFRDERTIPPERLTLELIDVPTVTGFIAWLRTSRHNSPSTCNQRLAAISSYFSWMQTQDPARMACCQDILAIPSSKHDQPAIAHLTVEQTRLLLALPDRSTRQGRRDATLLATLYDTAARVQETADLRVRDIRLEDPAMVALTGKGRKARHVPIDANTAALLAAYLTERHLDSPGHDDRPVFFNQHRAKLSRGGIAWILRKYQAQAVDPTLASVRLSPHVLRHSRAMHLYDAGVPLPYIRDILGHVDLSTTEIYARASTEAKRKALEVVYGHVVSADLAEWNQLQPAAQGARLGEIAPVADLARRYEVLAQQAVLEQLARPGRVLGVGLSAGQVFDVLRVDQPQLERRLQHPVVGSGRGAVPALHEFRTT